MAKSEGELTWKDIEIGAIATEPGSARQYQTGGWRSQRPTYNFNKCILLDTPYFTFSLYDFQEE